MPTVLVTGANRGLGLEFVRQYAADGWNAIASCRDPATAEQLAQLAAEHGGQISIEKLDVTDHSAIDALADKYAGEPLDLLINNAGIIGPRPAAENLPRQRFGTVDYAVWDEVIRINTFGPVKMAEAFLNSLLRATNARIVSISSTVGSITESGPPAIPYGSSKAALNKAMTVVGETLREHGVIIALLCPGHTKTRMGLATGATVATVEVEDSVSGMRGIIDGLTMADSGTFTRYNGERIDW